MLAVALRGNDAAAEATMRRLRLAIVGPRLGGIESLVSRPALMSHMNLSAAEREALGIGDNLLRISVGCEDVDDVISDFDRALGK